MSTALLTNLRDYLYGTLSPDNMIWLAAQLTEYADKQTQSESLKPYTKEELHARIAQSEADIMAGRTISHEEMMREWEEELAREEKELLEFEEAV